MSDMSRLHLLRPHLAADSHESCKRDLADMTRQRDEALARLAQLEAALVELVAIKDWKDKYGKDMEYQRDQPVAWEKARDALAAKEPSDE